MAAGTNGWDKTHPGASSAAALWPGRALGKSRRARTLPAVTMSNVRAQRGVGRVGSESLAEAVGTTGKPFSSVDAPSPALLLHLLSETRTTLGTTRVARGWARRSPGLCWVGCRLFRLYALVHAALHPCKGALTPTTPLPSPSSSGSRGSLWSGAVPMAMSG